MLVNQGPDDFGITHTCQVTLDISRSPIKNGAPGNIQGNLDRYDHHHKLIGG